MWHQLSRQLFKKLDFFSLMLWWVIISILTNISGCENKLPFIVSTRCCFYRIQPGAVSYFWVFAHTQQLLVFTCSCLSLSPPLCFSLSFFSLVDLLLWLWPDDASFQHLMGWESSSFLCLWDHDVISYFGFFHRPDASGGCGKNASSTFQMFSGQLENHTWIVWLGNIAGLCRRWQWERSWKHSSYAALLSGVSQRVVGVLSDCTAYSGLELGRWNIFLPALHSLSSISSSSFSFWVKHKILLISCKANAVLFVQCLRVISAVED